MIMCYKIITNKVNINMDNFFMFNQRSTRGHEFKLRKVQRFTKQQMCQNLSIRSIDDWNSLPSEVIRAKSTNAFKRTNIGMMKDVNPPLRRYYNVIGVCIYRHDLYFSRNIYYYIIIRRSCPPSVLP